MAVKKCALAVVLLAAAAVGQTIASPYTGGTARKVQLHSHCRPGVSTCSVNDDATATTVFSSVAFTVSGTTATSSSFGYYDGVAVGLDFTLTGGTPVDGAYQFATVTADRHTATWTVAPGHDGSYSAATITILTSPENVARMYISLGYDWMTFTSKHGNVQTTPPPVGGINYLLGAEQFSQAPTDATQAPHIVVAGVADPVTASSTTPMQTVISDAIGKGGIAVLAHPMLDPNYHITRADMALLTGYTGVEVCAYECGDGVGEDRWNYALDLGLHIFGYSTTDSKTTSAAIVANGYVTAYTATNTEAAVLDALKTGNFVSTKCMSQTIAGDTCYLGIPLSFSVVGNQITATMTDATHTGQFTWSTQGQPAARVSGTGVQSDSFTVTGNEGYVRVMFIRSDETTNYRRRSYSQPFWVSATGPATGLFLLPSPIRE